MSYPPTNPFSTQQLGYKYTFQLELRKLYVNPSLPCDVKILWARGQQKIQSQNPIKLQPPDNQVILQECFCNKSTVLFNKKALEFRKKQSKIQIILYANGSPKQGGEYILNLCQILDPFNIKKSQQKIYRVVTRQQKPHCQIQFKLTADYCQQMIRDEQKSIGSGVGSISSKNTTTMMSNTTGMSQQKNYVQKKNLFLYQAPSKDNQSVASYTSYNTGVMRYGSNRKERQDSVRKQDYGVPKRQSVDMFTKNANLKPNVSQQYDIKSRNGSYNRFTQQNFDNKTENFDPVNNKQLIQQQSKRSKLQAEVSKLNIYVKQQSSKLTEYITQNTKLKQQLTRLVNQQQNNKPSLQSVKHHYQEIIQKLKRQNNELHNRSYELNNQNRQIHRKLDNVNLEKDRIQQDLRRIRLEKQRLQAKYQNLNRNMQGIVMNKEQSSKQIQNLRNQLQHIKSLNMNLRQTLEKEGRKIQELEYGKKYHLVNIQQSNKKKQQKLYELEREYSVLRGQLQDKQSEIVNKKQLIYRLERTNEEYKSKILQNQNDKFNIFEQNKFLKLQNDKIRKQLSILNENNLKMRDDKTAEYEQKNVQLQGMNYQYQQKIRNLEYEVEQNKKSYQQIVGLNDTIRRQLDDKKTQIYRLENNIKGLREFQNKFYAVDKGMLEKQRQLGYMKQQNGKLLIRVSQIDELNKKLLQQMQQTQRKMKQNSHPDVDVNQILRESVQMQVELKFKTDQLIKLKNIQEKYEQTQYQLEIENKNRIDLQNQIERIEKELKQKNKLYLIEVEKGKLFMKQKSDYDREVEKIRLQLKHCQQIIFNGDKQVKQMSQHIKFLQSQNRKLIHTIQSVEKQISYTKSRLNQIVKFQNRIKQLEKQISERNYTVNLLTTNLSNLQKEIGQLNSCIKNKDMEIQEVRRSGQSVSQRIIEIQETKNVVSSELQRILAEKKSVQLKNQMIMQQIHSLKKQFQEQKGRSTSIVSLRSSEEQLKIRQLQNELEKKDKMISKLTKQKLEIEEENINLHVQVMKKLSEMEKNKDNQQYMSSQKVIYTTPKGNQ